MAPIPTAQLVLGVDTHRDLHVAVLLDRVGRKLATASFGTTDAANAVLLEWTRRHGQVTIAGVEGTGSYGYRLAQQLIAHGIQVVEVNRPDRARRRRKGKSDPVDAEAAARAVLAGDATAIPKCRNGVVGQLRALVMARRSAIKARTQATNQLRALLVDGDDELRGRLGPLRKHHLAHACADLDPGGGVFHLALRSLGRRWLALHQEIVDLDQAITTSVTRIAPRLLARHSVGVHTAARLLLTAGDNPTRLRSEAAFAALCGTSPVEASSGQTVRHRLNRGGDRAANNALWTIAFVRLIHDPRTRAYAAKRTAQGSSRKEILRCLKRTIARELYPLILEALTAPEPA
jgi:transposase